MEFTTIELTLEQEVIIRAADLEIDGLELEELRVCLKQATRSDLIKTNIIHQLAQPIGCSQKSRPRLGRLIRSHRSELVGRVRSQWQLF